MVGEIKLQTKESLLEHAEISKQQIDEALDLAAGLVKKQVDYFHGYFPDSNSKKNFYEKAHNVEWTTGFWTGEIWLAYERLQDKLLLDEGNAQVESFYKRIVNKVDVNHHDMGFLYSPSCVAAYILTGNPKGKEAALLAADQLMERFQEKGQFFQAWGEIGTRENYRLIIDCLLNMPLLFWASEVTGKQEYADKAKKHIETAMNCVVRKDFSTYHTYYFDPETGKPLKGVTCQGFRDESAWARGQAWGVYGTAMAYRYVKRKEYINLFEKVTDYFLFHLPNDFIPYWDFEFDDGSDEPKDTSASAIVICGMLEMCKYLSNEKASWYKSMAKRLLKVLVEQCAVQEEKQSNGLLLHGTYAKASEYNTCTDRGVDECNLWGDYFYMEALTRLSKEWNMYW